MQVTAWRCCAGYRECRALPPTRTRRPRRRAGPHGARRNAWWRRSECSTPGRAAPTGPPRIHAALRRAGRAVNGKKVERLMRRHRIVGITRRRRRGLTRQAKRVVFAADLIGRDFTAPRPGMRLVGDMSELITWEGTLYLATCIDLATREVIGWAMADHHRAALPVAALRMAAGRGGLEAGCIMPTDRGSEYTSDEFRTETSKLRMR
ncbi:DDE-type integrase/transposase/recombinase [Streptomyces sp. NPDC005774]|uniref:DDE-type integrase/transposase/recombinase n=1 Tax=Streptomyces sp. NPDC005774 TaxID=3364728 RepID=UPI0036AE037B